MDIYTEKDSDIIYEVSFDTEYTRINYPPFICQYSKGLLIRINLLTNRKPLFDSAPDYEGTELIWFNYDKTTETSIKPFARNKDGYSLYFLMDEKFTKAYNEYYPSFPIIIIRKNKKEILRRRFCIVIEENPIQKGG